MLTVHRSEALCLSSLIGATPFGARNRRLIVAEQAGLGNAQTGQVTAVTHEAKRTARVRIVVNDVGFVLAPGESADGMKQEIDAAVRAGGGFVAFTVADGSRVNVLVSPMSHVVISVEPHDAEPDEPPVAIFPRGDFFDHELL